MPISPTFKLVTVPFALTFMTTSIPAFRAWSDRQLGTRFEKHESKNGFRLFFTRDAMILLGMYEILAQLFIAPLLSPGSRPNPKMGKLTFATPLDIPHMLYTIILLFFVRKVIASNVCGDLPSVQDKRVKALVRGSCTTIGFLFATLLRDAQTPLDLIVPAILTILSFKLPQFDKVAQFAYNEDYPKLTFEGLFDSNTDDWVAILTTFAVWWGMSQNFLAKMPGYEKVDEIAQAIFGGSNGVMNYVGNIIEFVLLFMLPMTIQYRNKDRPQLGYTVGFATGLLIKYALPMRKYANKFGKKLDKMMDKLPGSALTVPF